MKMAKGQLEKALKEKEDEINMLKDQIKNYKEEFDFHTIKTFEDACKRLGIDGKIEIKCGNSEREQRLIAICQLEIIFEAINDGWQPDWNNINEAKYYPWFIMRSVCFACSDYARWHTTSGAGSRLCTYSREVSDYIGKQFEDLYKVAFSY